MPHLVIINDIVNKAGKATQHNVCRNLGRNNFHFLLLIFHCSLYIGNKKLLFSERVGGLKSKLTYLTWEEER